MTATAVRTAGETRRRILEAAFEEFYLNGFQAGSVERIVANAGVTKGALYYHFDGKADLGYSVVDEVLREPILSAYIGALEDDEGDPLAAIQMVLRERADTFVDTGIRLGCPLNNLMQEMSPLDEEFRRRLGATLEAWRDGFADALERARAGGWIRHDVDPRRVANFIVASVEGTFGTAKNADSVDLLRTNLETLADFLETLRPG